jgi:UDP-glucose 4-epimerase
VSRVLVTGGAGYIGSHTCVELIEAGHDVVVLDNLSNSSPGSLAGVERITGVRPPLIEADLLDRAALQRAFEAYRPDAVIHFAAMKYVGESVRCPSRYFQNNVAGSVNLIDAMQQASVRRMVFSSSCTVYGQPDELPITEDAPTGQTASPYGLTKHMVERMLLELQRCDPDWSFSILRYFNPIGAHPSGEIGENPTRPPENVMPHLIRVALGRQERLHIWGGDYPTRDGTGIRDYLHVVDLARGHVAALDRLQATPGATIHNLGTGRGYTVLELVDAMQQACGRDIPYAIRERRPGDVAAVFADAARAQRELGWSASRSLTAMCRDAWRWELRSHNEGSEPA